MLQLSRPEARLRLDWAPARPSISLLRIHGRDGHSASLDPYPCLVTSECDGPLPLNDNSDCMHSWRRTALHGDFSSSNGRGDAVGNWLWRRRADRRGEYSTRELLTCSRIGAGLYYIG